MWHVFKYTTITIHMSNLFSKMNQGGVAPHLRFFQPTLLIESLAFKTLLSILQISENVKFILRKLAKNVNFSEFHSIDVRLSILQNPRNVKFIFKQKLSILQKTVNVKFILQQRIE